MADIVIIGGGFAGLWAALAAARRIHEAASGHSVLLVGRDSFLTVRPRLYEAHPENLRTSLQPVLETAGVELLESEVLAIDPDRQIVSAVKPDRRQMEVSYQRLIVATGSIARVPPVPGLAEHGFSIDDFASALVLDEHLACICAAAPPPDGDTFAIIGAGFTGIELACEMRDRIAIHGDEQRAQVARIVLLEKSPVIGPDLGPGPRPQIEAALREARIEVRTSVTITGLDSGAVMFGDGSRLETATIIATTGLAAHIPPGLDMCPRDPMGRLGTDDFLKVAGTDHIFAAGDAAAGQVDETHMSLMSCQHAMPMGRFAGHNAACDLTGGAARAYRQPFYQTCLGLGRSGAVLTHDWDRKVVKTGAEAGALKQNINTKWIYPPAGTRDEIFALADIDYKPAR